eukprot:4469659-Pyramimonas_sp.AAC.2
MDAALITVMQIHLTEPEGDILMFLTGQEEIDTACQVGLHTDVKPFIVRPRATVLTGPIVWNHRNADTDAASVSVTAGTLRADAVAGQGGAGPAHPPGVLRAALRDADAHLRALARRKPQVHRRHQHRGGVPHHRRHLLRRGPGLRQAEGEQQ